MIAEGTPTAVQVTKDMRSARNGHRPGVVWLTGVSGAGKSSIATGLEAKLHGLGCRTYRLDGDVVRLGLSADLAFSAADRTENVRRVSEVARLMADAGLIVIVALISPFAADRDRARHLLSGDAFLEVHVDAPLRVVQQRDPKGLYRRARHGELEGLTAVDSPYEAPQAPALRLDTTVLGLDACVEALVDLLRAARVLEYP
jgi:bifunctional enzyme CysN/CysC